MKGFLKIYFIATLLLTSLSHGEEYQLKSAFDGFQAIIQHAGPLDQNGCHNEEVPYHCH